MQHTRPKPLGRKAYGSIPHLPGSAAIYEVRGKRISEGQYRICCKQSRCGDTIVAQEKLDGSCCAVANVDGMLVALTRAGNPAWESGFLHCRLFALWVTVKQDLFDFLKPGERLVGEWLAQAHGTRYNLKEVEPFVAFDIMTGADRCTFAEFSERVEGRFRTPEVLHHDSEAISIESVLNLLENLGREYNPEGAVWRVENASKVDFLCKYVRPDYIPGCYLPTASGEPPVWNLTPGELYARWC